jgi:hypothetical protein
MASLKRQTMKKRTMKNNKRKNHRGGKGSIKGNMSKAYQNARTAIVELEITKYLNTVGEDIKNTKAAKTLKKKSDEITEIVSENMYKAMDASQQSIGDLLISTIKSTSGVDVVQMQKENKKLKTNLSQITTDIKELTTDMKNLKERHINLKETYENDTIGNRLKTKGNNIKNWVKNAGK